MALALNYLKWVDMPLNKETKPYILHIIIILILLQNLKSLNL